MDFEERQYIEKKAKYLATQLRDMNNQYIQVCRRRHQFDVPHQVVHIPFTMFTQGGVIKVLAGEFDRAVRLVKQLKAISDMEIPRFMLDRHEQDWMDRRHRWHNALR